MKDSFKKIQSLAEELAKNADVANGGGIIILATNPNSEKGEPNSVVFMKGKGIDILATLSASFKANDTLKEMVKESLFLSSVIPSGLIKEHE